MINWLFCVEGKIPQDEPAILPLTTNREEKRKGQFGAPLAKRLGMERDRDRDRERDRDRDRERDRERDSELMPPPGSHKKKIQPPPADVDQPIDPNEPTYCTCGQVRFVHFLTGEVGLGQNKSYCLCLQFHLMTFFVFINSYINYCFKAEKEFNQTLGLTHLKSLNVLDIQGLMSST